MTVAIIGRVKLPRLDLRLGVALVMLGIAVPIASSLVVGLLAPSLVLPGGVRLPLWEVFDLSPPPIFSLGPSATPLAGDHADLHVEAVALDELKPALTLRVSGHRVCAPTCAAADLVLVALRPDEPTRPGLPSLATVPLPARDGPVLATVELPMRGRIIHYPFDTFELLLGVALQQTDTAGVARPLPPAEAATHLQLTLEEVVPQLELSVPVAMDPALFRSSSLPLEYVMVERLTLSRNGALKLMTVVLLLLIAGTATYTVFLRSFHDLVLGFGGLILGVWSVRAILVPSALNRRTGVDIALVVVITFLLVALGVRAALIIAGPRASGGKPPPVSSGAPPVVTNAHPADGHEATR